MWQKIRDTQLSWMRGTMVGVLTGVLTETPHPALPRKGGGEAEARAKAS